MCQALTPSSFHTRILFWGTRGTDFGYLTQSHTTGVKQAVEWKQSPVPVSGLLNHINSVASRLKPLKQGGQMTASLTTLDAAWTFSTDLFRHSRRQIKTNAGHRSIRSLFAHHVLCFLNMTYIQSQASSELQVKVT